MTTKSKIWLSLILPESDNSVSGQLFLNGLCLPSHPSLTDADLERVAGVVKGLARLETLPQFSAS